MRYVTKKSLGILGCPDSKELWQEIIDQIPLRKGMKFLNVACGHGTEARILARKLVASGLYTQQEALDSIYLLDKYPMFTNEVLLVGFKKENIILADFLTWETDLHFDVVLGNPPYQDGKNKGFYKNFIKKSFDISEHVALVVPNNWMHKDSSLYNRYGRRIIFSNNDCLKYFDIGLGSDVHYFIANGTDNSSFENISRGTLTRQDHSSFSNFKLLKIDPEVQKIMDKVYKKGMMKYHKGKGQNEFFDHKTITHQYEVFLSSHENRKCQYSIIPMPGYGIEKVIVSHIVEPYRFERFGEISKKGVGRYSVYFEDMNAALFIDTPLYAFIDKHFRNGRYACLDIPTYDPSKDIYEQYDLTADEIKYIKASLQS